MRIQPPNFAAEHDAVEDLLAKGEISAEEAKGQHERIRRASLEFVVGLKGGRHGVKKKGKGGKAEMTRQREIFLAQKRREFADQILAEHDALEFPELSDGDSAKPEVPQVHFSMPLSTPVHLAESSPPPEE
jgi:hypothetical protein